MSWFVKYIIPLLAIGLLVVAARHVLDSGAADTAPVRPPAAQPPTNPFVLAVAGSGIIEAQTQNISVGTPVPGVVLDVAVQVGEQVEVDDELFRIDARDMEAQAQVLSAAVDAARAEVQRLERLPRPEELPLKEAMVTQAEARLRQAQSNWQRTEGLIAQKATTNEQVDRVKEQVQVAEADLARAQADLKLLQAGAWEFDLAKAKVAVAQAEADLRRMQTEIQRRCVHALVAGEVLQVNVRPGEFVGAPASQALVVLGDTSKLHVRMDIDEHDIPRFQTTLPGIAQLRGDPSKTFPLKFQRVEPFVVPKRSLTGDNTERIDTRVLQVIYEIGPHDTPLYVGQQVDVFLNASPTPESPSVEDAAPPPNRVSRETGQSADSGR